MTLRRLVTVFPPPRVCGTHGHPLRPRTSVHLPRIVAASVLQEPTPDPPRTRDPYVFGPTLLWRMTVLLCVSFHRSELIVVLSRGCSRAANVPPACRSGAARVPPACCAARGATTCRPHAAQTPHTRRPLGRRCRAGRGRPCAVHERHVGGTLTARGLFVGGHVGGTWAAGGPESERLQVRKDYKETHTNLRGSTPTGAGVAPRRVMSQVGSRGLTQHRWAMSMRLPARFGPGSA